MFGAFIGVFLGLWGWLFKYGLRILAGGWEGTNLEGDMGFLFP